MLTWLLPSRTAARLSRGAWKNSLDLNALTSKCICRRAYFLFLSPGFKHSTSAAGLITCLLKKKKKISCRPQPHRRSQHIWQIKAGQKKKQKDVHSTRLSLLNGTWREIPLTSSWQRHSAGRQIKQPLSKSPINTSHSPAPSSSSTLNSVPHREKAVQQ